jgi:hypothetical protein
MKIVLVQAVVMPELRLPLVLGRNPLCYQLAHW